MSVFVALALPVVVSLGVWQFDRAAGKRDSEQTFIERMSARPVTPPAQLDDVDFLRVRLVGEFEAGRYFLVDNQVSGGRLGYWVIASFRSPGGQRWLVNRGWIAAPLERDTLPEVGQPLGRIEIVGALWP
ncbi:MAG: SURF1 family protein, partial [Gammaproteobacteria bacterium]|nr:SURF1 family protein [Gammaproteobacteria bacterium]